MQADLAHSRSLHSITEPPGEAGATGASPALPTREPRQEKPGETPAQSSGSTLRGPQATVVSIAAGRASPGTAPVLAQRQALSARVSRLSSGVRSLVGPGSCGGSVGGTPSTTQPTSALSVRARGQQQCPGLSLSSARKLAPSDSAAALRQTDAGSGGTCGPPLLAGDGALGGAGCGSLAVSWSTPQLEAHKVPGYRGRELREPVRDTPTHSPRPLNSARARPVA
mmetsp:Transcript_91894/g.286455  ORF Transcript_91894/g.286455 Transcript_91894/m.286455 type:complete len:225 (+) Transcript_91894:162-836(+)